MAPTSNPNLRLQLDNTLRGSATWLFVAAGFIVMDMVFVLADFPLRVLFNLSLLQLTEMLWPLAGWLALGSGLAVVFCALGWLGRRGQAWAFGVGIGLYILDGGLTLARGDLVNLAFHLFIIYGLWVGVNTARQQAALKPPDAAAGGGPSVANGPS